MLYDLILLIHNEKKYNNLWRSRAAADPLGLRTAGALGRTQHRVSRDQSRRNRYVPLSRTQGREGPGDRRLPSDAEAGSGVQRQQDEL